MLEFVRFLSRYSEPLVLFLSAAGNGMISAYRDLTGRRRHAINGRPDFIPPSYRGVLAKARCFSLTLVVR